MQLAIDREHLVERYSMSNREFLCLDGEIVILKLPSKILRSDHGRRETTKSILVRDVKGRSNVYRGMFVPSIQGGQLHISKGDLGGVVDPADIYWSRKGDDGRKNASMVDLSKCFIVSMRRPGTNRAYVPCLA